LPDVLHMRLSRNPKLIMKELAGDERRRHGRLRCKQTTCCVGQVIDLSASGMRVKRRGRPLLDVGDELQLSIQVNADDISLKVSLRVVRIERSGFRQHFYGMEFIDLTDDQKSQLSTLARVVNDQIIFSCSQN
jgi:hypothetical protein